MKSRGRFLMKICLFNLVKRHTRARATAGDCCFLVNDPLDLAQTRGLLRIERDREALKILERILHWVLRGFRVRSLRLLSTVPSHNNWFWRIGIYIKGSWDQK